KSDRRHLIDIRPTNNPPPARVIGGVAFVEPDVLTAMKVLSAEDRSHRPEGLMDLADLQRLLEHFPELRIGPAVEHHLRAFNAPVEAYELWAQLRAEESSQHS